MSTEADETAGLVFYWTKTAFKPYDVAVTAALLIAKRHLREKLVIHSNGRDPQWTDAKEICQQNLGYGTWFSIIEHPHIEIFKTSDGVQHEHNVVDRVLVEIDPASLGL